MIGPKLREYWSPEFAGQPKHVLVAALGKKLREEFPTTRFNFTQPIIDNVLEDTNGTSANLAVEFSGADSEVLLELARKTGDMLKTVPGAVDVNIEQEGPQPQLLITPDRALCARYNVRIEDVTKLINTALGGDPIGFVYEGERKFDIVAKFDRQAINSAQAIGRLPIFTAEGVAVPLARSPRIGRTAWDCGPRSCKARSIASAPFCWRRSWRFWDCSPPRWRRDSAPTYNDRWRR